MARVVALHPCAASVPPVPGSVSRCRVRAPRCMRRRWPRAATWAAAGRPSACRKTAVPAALVRVSSAVPPGGPEDRSANRG